MSSRRERPPSGRTNASFDKSRPARPTKRPTTGKKPLNPASSREYNNHVESPLVSPAFDRPKTAPITRSNHLPVVEQQPQPQRPPSSRPQTGEKSEISTNEILRRMREKNDRERQLIETEEIRAMGEYNAFSRPKLSKIAPLRSVLLDPEINNFPRSKTRSELMKRIRYASMPHPSYDLDNDGYVSTTDYKLAKRFDFDGNGVLDPDERNIGKRVLADEFFRRHSGDLYNFGTQFTKNSHKENVEKLVSSYSFERTYDRLMSVERTLKAESSKPLIDCIRNDEDQDFQQHKYYNNRMDTTAWTDFTRLPRQASSPSISAGFDAFNSSNTNFKNSANSDHNPFTMTRSNSPHRGSRKQLLFLRSQQMRNDLESSTNFTASMEKNNHLHAYRRVNMITDIKKENS